MGEEAGEEITIYLEPPLIARDPSAEVKVITKPDRYGLIRLPPKVLAIDLLEEFRRRKERPPPIMMQWIDKYGFYMATINVGLETMRSSGARGVKQFALKANFENQDIIIHDVAPKTEWVSKDLPLNIAFTIDSNLKFVLADIKATVKFEYKFEKKIAKVISYCSGNVLSLYLEASDQYLDGGHDIIAVFSVPRSIDSDFIELNFSEASAVYDIKRRPDIAYTKENAVLKIYLKQASA